MAFLRNLLATIVGLFVFSIIGFFLFIAIITAASTEEIPTVEENTVLYFPMSGVVEEKAVDDPFLEAFGNGVQVHSLLDIIAAIDNARSDDRVKGIFLEPMFLGASSAAMQEIRDALIAFKEAGKFIYAYGEFVSESELMVTSVADTFILNPTGSLEFNGFSVNVMFYKGLFEKLDIEPEIFRVGEFKGAVEPFMRKELSDENKLQYNELLESIYGQYLRNISESTGKTVEELNDISSNMKVVLPQDAVTYGLADRLGYKDEARTLVNRALGKDSDAKLEMMKLKHYAQAVAAEGAYSRNKIAVIVAEGEIVMGGDDGIVGKTFAKEIKEARESSSVKAIVMRINSPGGSLTASDLIWRELMLTKGEKPIIASMSGTAASGGYYIAMPADTVVAQPNTVTGSIGIFALWFNFSEFLENKVGITNDVVKTGEYSDILSATRPLSDQEKAIIQRGVDEGYVTFTTKAAQGRDMERTALLKIASGRVWSGEQALENGLVDVLGSFNDAVLLAAEAAGIQDDYRLRFYPEERTFIEEFFDKMNSRARSVLIGEEVTEIQKHLHRLKEMHGIQARMAGDITID